MKLRKTVSFPHPKCRNESKEGKINNGVQLTEEKETIDTEIQLHSRSFQITIISDEIYHLLIQRFHLACFLIFYGFRNRRRYSIWKYVLYVLLRDFFSHNCDIILIVIF